MQNLTRPPIFVKVASDQKVFRPYRQGRLIRLNHARCDQKIGADLHKAAAAQALSRLMQTWPKRRGDRPPHAGWDDARKRISLDRDAIESLEANVRARLEYARRSVEESHGSPPRFSDTRFLSRKHDSLGCRTISICCQVLG
jgi:hypothetical protein